MCINSYASKLCLYSIGSFYSIQYPSTYLDSEHGELYSQLASALLGEQEGIPMLDEIYHPPCIPILRNGIQMW